MITVSVDEALLETCGEIEKKCEVRFLEVGTDSSAARSATARWGCSKVRHLETRFLWIQEKVREKSIHIVKIGTATNRADLQTKALEPARHSVLVGLLPVKRSKTLGCSTSSVGSVVAALFLRPSCGEAQHLVTYGCRRFTRPLIHI